MQPRGSLARNRSSNALRFCYARRPQSGTPEAVGSGRRHVARPGSEERQPPGPRCHGPRHEDEEQLGQQREAGDEEGAGDHQPVVLLSEAELDQPAEPSTGDERGEAGGGDHLHGRRPDAGHDQRQGQRQVDAGDDLAPAHAHRLGGLPDVGVDPAEADVGVGQDRREGEDGQRDRGGLGAEADRADGEEREQRQGRDGAAHVGDHDDRPAAAPARAQPDPERQGQDHRGEHGDHRDRQVLAEQVEDAVRPGPVVRVVEVEECVGEGVHERTARVHGVSSRSTPASSTSANSARSTQPIVPVTISAR